MPAPPRAAGRYFTDDSVMPPSQRQAGMACVAVTASGDAVSQRRWTTFVLRTPVFAPGAARRAHGAGSPPSVSATRQPVDPAGNEGRHDEQRVKVHAKSRAVVRRGDRSHRHDAEQDELPMEVGDRLPGQVRSCQMGARREVAQLQEQQQAEREQIGGVKNDRKLQMAVITHEVRGKRARPPQAAGTRG